MGIDGERCRKIQKDIERYEKIAKDSGCIGEYWFSCVASAHVLLNRRFLYLGGSWFVSDLFLVFVSVFMFELSAV